MSTGADQLNPADNAGLGLARAVSVVRELATDKRLSSARLLPLSGGQLIDIGDQLSSGASPGAVKERRRIEIRVRRSAAYTAPTEVVIPPPKDQPKASELNFQGEELLRAGRPVEALEYFSSALALDPSYTLAMANRGLAHHRAKNLGAALKDYSSAIALKHEGAYVWTSRGIAKFDSGDFKGASADLDRAIGIEPNIHSALYQVISQNRQEKPGLKKFIEHLAQLRLSETSFFLQITNLYQGGSTISQVRAAAKTTRERCEAEFYVGQLLVVTKRLLDARSAFQSAVAFCDPSSFEHHTAAIELTRVHSTP